MKNRRKSPVPGTPYLIISQTIFLNIPPLSVGRLGSDQDNCLISFALCLKSTRFPLLEAPFRYQKAGSKLWLPSFVPAYVWRHRTIEFEETDIHVGTIRDRQQIEFRAPKFPANQLGLGITLRSERMFLHTSALG